MSSINIKNEKKEETTENSIKETTVHSIIWDIVPDGVVTNFIKKGINKIKSWYIVSDGVKIELE